MQALALFALSSLKHDAALLWAWLCHRSFWQLVSMGLAAFALLQHFQLAGERKHSAKVETQLEKAVGQLNAISSKRSEQRTVTKDRIVEVTKLVHDAGKRAEVVEKAPLPGNCRTPKEVSGADL